MAVFQSQHMSGSATAPAAGTDLAEIVAANLPTGLYRVVVEPNLSALGIAVIALADVQNLQVAVGVRTPIRIPATSPTEMYFNLSGSEKVLVETVGAATANIVYTVGLTATQVS